MEKPDILIIEKVLDNKATPQEARMVVRWFHTDEGMEWLQERMDKDISLINEGEEEIWVNHTIPSQVMYDRIMKQIRIKKIKVFVFRAAAVLLPFVFLISMFYRLDQRVDLFSSSEYEEVVVPRGEKMQLVFQDGTKLLLNAGSTARFPKKFGFDSRKIELEGEGWFEVSKNKKRPFIVCLNKMDVKVLGTQFNVKAYNEDKDISVALVEGKVELEFDKLPSYQLSPGEKAIYNKETGSYKVIRESNIKNNRAWKDDIMIFEKAKLDEVLKTLSRVYNIDFVVDNDKAYNFTFTLKTRKTTSSLTLQEIEMISPLRFEQDVDCVRVKLK